MLDMSFLDLFCLFAKLIGAFGLAFYLVILVPGSIGILLFKFLMPSNTETWRIIIDNQKIDEAAKRVK